MKVYLYMQERVMGPYLPEEITRQFGGVSPETLVWPEGGGENGPKQWRAISLVPDLADCVKREISEPLVKYAAPDSAKLSLNILSTDDNSNIRELLWHILTDAGHMVEFAKDGEEVFARLAVKKYDLVILDVNMPKMNGYRVSEVLHKKLTNPPKVMIFTGRDPEKERLQFACSEADVILSKGIDNDKLIETIEGLFHEKPEEALKAKESFIPEPPPPVLKELPAGGESVKLLKEEIKDAMDLVKPAPPAKTAFTHITENKKAKSEEIARGAVATASHGCEHPVSDGENSGKPEIPPNQLMLENKDVRSELADIRRLLKNLTLNYKQLAGQFEQQTLKILKENDKAAQKLEADWHNLRNYVRFAILAALAAALAAMLR
jgi:CheY-like chemotaxis protein